MLAHPLLVVAALMVAGQSASGQTTERPSTASDSSATYSSAALARVIEMASRANRSVPQELTGYTALIESEASLLVNTPGGPDGAIAGTAAATTEAAAQIEQFVLKSQWDRSGRFDQQQVGYRSRLLGPSISALNVLPKPWTAPALYGNRLSLLFGGAPSLLSADTVQRAMPAVHPFADDRTEFYRYSGGDTVATIKLPTGDIPLVRILVTPLVDREQRLMLFAGDVYIDGNTGSIVRMRGRIRVGPVKASTAARLIRFVAKVQEVGYIDFENSLQKGKFWLPSRQRLEYQAITSFTEARATIRVQSVWREMQLETRDSAALAPEDTLGLPNYKVRLTGADSLGSWNSWGNSLGALSTEGSARDFDDVAPPEFRPTGGAQIRFQARGFSDIGRINRVEGLFVGAAALIDFREAAPGATVRLFGGWATLPNTAKGGAEGALVRGPWVATARAERQLASTNDFALTLGGSPGNPIASLFGVENVDWVDRRILSGGLMREFGIKHSSALRVELARGNDRGFTQQRLHGLLGGDFRYNRMVTPGSYTRARAQFDFGRNIVTSPLSSGLGASFLHENGFGELDWQRSVIQTFGQRMFKRFIVAARVEGSVVTGDSIPAQQIIEVGGIEGLPGYEYKEFSGDQALLARATVGYFLPIREEPIRVGRLTLPAIAPQLQVGLFTGVTSASGTTKALLPLYVFGQPTNGWRGTVDLRIRFFGGAFSVGASRPIDSRKGWKAQFGIGGVL
jgi:hypothetical protein